MLYKTIRNVFDMYVVHTMWMLTYRSSIKNSSIINNANVYMNLCFIVQGIHNQRHWYCHKAFQY
jgi:hypothetical protein